MKKIIVSIVALSIIAITMKAQIAYKYYVVNGTIHTLLGPTVQAYNNMVIYNKPDGGHILSSTVIVIDKYIHFNLNSNVLPAFALLNNANCCHLQQEWFSITNMGILPNNTFVANINTSTEQELTYTILESIDNGKTFIHSPAVNINSCTFQINSNVATNTNALQFIIKDKATSSTIYQSPTYYTNILATVYPTITNNNINIDYASLEGVFSIVNTAGSIVKQGNLQQFYNNINVSALPNGSYFINILDNANNIRITKQIQVLK